MTAAVIGTIHVTRSADSGTDRPDLTGQVRDAEGEPLPDARVMISSAEVREGTSPFCPTCYPDCGKQSVTDESGRFRIESLDPDLLFRVLVVGKGYQPKFVDTVDPFSDPLTVSLDEPKRQEVKPTRQINGRVVDSGGSPISEAIVEVKLTSQDLPDGGSLHYGGAMEGLDPLAVTDQDGQFRLTAGEDFTYANLRIEAIGFARRQVKLTTGKKQHRVILTEGATVTGRVLDGGRPVSEVPLGLAAAERSFSKLQFTGELTIGTQKDGRFAFVNVPPDREYILYGKMEKLGPRGALSARSIDVGPDGSTLDVGELQLEPGHRLAGRVSLADGAQVPKGTRLMVDRENAWDNMEVKLDDKGRFTLEGVPEETLSIDIQVPGYRLSTWNPSFNPKAYHGELIGRVVDDIVPFHILMEKGHPFEPDDDFDRRVPDKHYPQHLPLRGMASWQDRSKSFAISGRVVDARSGEPVEQFRVTPGRQHKGKSKPYWWRHRETVAHDGEYTLRFQRGPGKPMIRIRADGYYASVTPEPLTPDTERADFELTPMGLPTAAVSK